VQKHEWEMAMSKTIHKLTKRREALIMLGSALGGLTLAQRGFAACAVSELFTNGFENGVPIVPGSCVLIPSETAGPYPLSSLLANSTFVRSNITEGLPGILLRMRFRVVNLNASCAPIENAAVYLWQTNRDGLYSGYSQPEGNTVGQTFCRGVQLTDCNGDAVFETIFPGWYSGRITHAHFQVFLNGAFGGAVTRTSQVAWPLDTVAQVYAAYPRGQNTTVTSFANDGVFSDGVVNQLALISGDNVSGYDSSLLVGIVSPI
jgi:protocatechuate 3,4-dioxygenase beta subunit